MVCWGNQYLISIWIQYYIGPIMHYNRKNYTLMALLVSLLYSTYQHNVYSHNWLQLTYKTRPFSLAFIFVQYIFEWTHIVMMILLLHLGRVVSQCTGWSCCCCWIQRRRHAPHPSPARAAASVAVWSWSSEDVRCGLRWLPQSSSECHPHLRDTNTCSNLIHI